MRLVRFLSEQREKHVLGQARRHLIDGEEILEWVRARHPETGRKGLFFITSHHALVSWSGTASVSDRIRWDEVRSWGFDSEADGGPVVCIQAERREPTVVQVVVETRDMAKAATGFMQRFSELAPRPVHAEVRRPNGGKFTIETAGEVRHRRRTPGDLARRVAITVLGAGLIAVGFVSIPFPGPWSFLLNIAGLAVLAREYDWAEDLLNWTKERFEAAKKRMAERKRRRTG